MIAIARIILFVVAIVNVYCIFAEDEQMKNDAISRQEAIDAFKKELTIGEQKGKYVTICSAVSFEGAKQILEALPAVQPQRWIPCNEKLPDNDDFVIVTILDERGDTPYRYSDFGWYFNKAKCWIIDAEERTDVIAWMPLPEPYKERRTDGVDC